jgi:epoxyqueuosine reductase
LIAALEIPEPIVRAHAVWALGKLGGARARAALEKIRKTDEAEQVRDEIEKTLEDL